jgi:hypothetical protein
MHRNMPHLIVNPFYIQREGEKGIYNIISRFKGTDLNNEEIKAYVGERNSNLKTDGLDSILDACLYFTRSSICLRYVNR